jgi:Fe-Mn family superoxide dismutase
MEYTARTFDIPEIDGISKEQIELHLGLYEGYVKHVNLLMSQMHELASSDTDYSYSIAEMRRRLGFEWNGMRLHELYFGALEGGSTALLASTTLYKDLTEQYGSFSKWLTIFTKLSARGPGWALLTYDPVAKHYFHVWVADHEVGQLATLPVIIALDHWEHAYLKDYAPSEKGAYVEAYLKALNWQTIEKRVQSSNT